MSFHESSTLDARFQAAIEFTTNQVVSRGMSVEDLDVDRELRRWLDGDEAPLPWAGDGVTADEWFFATTLYGEMTFEGQRTHIRKFFPRFVEELKRDIRNGTADGLRNWSLRSGWMKSRLSTMGKILRDRNISMEQYAESLRQLETKADSNDPMPAMDQVIKDHRATGWKTLSCFVRDCIRGNCFPIDSRVKKILDEFELPDCERTLVSSCLRINQPPRKIARIFYQAGGDPLSI